MTLNLQNVGRCIGNQWIVRHLSFQIGNDECLALVGPSGCGKSTTLRLIAGLDPVSEGSIAIGGHDVTQLTPAERSIGMVFQSYALLPHLTVFENLELGLKIRNVQPRDRSIKIKEFSISCNSLIEHPIGLLNCPEVSASVSLWHGP